MKTDQQTVYEFIKNHKIAVLSTVTSDFLPQSAVVGISVQDNLELLFGTINTSRKWVNLQKNPKVSLVIGWEGGKTVQYEGEAFELSNGDRVEALKNHFASVPSLAKFVSEKEAAIFKIKPKWLRYSDSSKDPAFIIELSF